MTNESLPANLPPDAPLFNVPADLLRILNRNAKLAGIPKHDERGRTVCLHGLRHTFGTCLNRTGVPMRTAQAAMRHTDPTLLDVTGAMDALPSLPLDDQTHTRERGKATVTGPQPLVPLLVPTTWQSEHKHVHR